MCVKYITKEKKMKKSVLVLSVFFAVILLTNIATSSSLVTFSGTYENEHIKLKAFNRIASWITRRGGGSSHKIKFTVTAKPGYKFLGKYNTIIYYGIHFTFKPKKQSIKSFSKGYAYASGSFLKSSIFTIRYYIKKIGEGKPKFVRKKFKMLMERKPRGSHDNVKMIIKEAK